MKNLKTILKKTILSVTAVSLATGLTAGLAGCGTSNPRSRVGNDCMEQYVSETDTYFNPRSRVGNDQKGN